MNIHLQTRENIVTLKALTVSSPTNPTSYLIVV